MLRGTVGCGGQLTYLTQAMTDAVTQVTSAYTVSASSDHTTALRGASVWSGGSNSLGQLSDCSTTDRAYLVPMLFCPGMPSGLAQIRTDNVTPITQAQYITEGIVSNIYLKFTITDPEANESLKPWVEVIAESGAFSAQCGVAGPGVFTAAPINSPVGGVPQAASVTVVGLVDNTRYKWRACSTYKAGKLGASPWSEFGAVGDDFIIDTMTPPTASVSDGLATDIDFQATTTMMAANWPAVIDGGSGLKRYEYCISTLAACGGTVVVTWTSTDIIPSFTRTGLALTAGTLYRVAVRATDYLNHVSAVTTSDGVRPDITNPTVVTLSGPGAATAPFGLTWTAATDTQSLAGYRLYRSTTSGTLGTAIATFGTGTLAYTETTLTTNGTYWYTIKAFDSAGNQGAGSNQLSVAYTAPIYLRNLTSAPANNAQALSYVAGSANDNTTEVTDAAPATGFVQLRAGLTNSVTLAAIPAGLQTDGWLLETRRSRHLPQVTGQSMSRTHTSVQIPHSSTFDSGRPR